MENGPWPAPLAQEGTAVDLDLDDEQELFRETAARFLADRWPTSAVRRLIGDASGLDRGVWDRGAGLGCAVASSACSRSI